MEGAARDAVANATVFLNTFYDAPDVGAILAELQAGYEPLDTPVALVHHANVNPATAIRPETRAMMNGARRTHMRLKINDELTATITNSVHCTRLIDTSTGEPYRLPLPMLARQLSAIGAQFTAQRFAKIVIRYGPVIHITQLVFSTGNVLEAGKVAFTTKRAMLYALVDMMRAAGLSNIGIGSRACQNLVSTGVLTFPVRLRLLQLRHSEGNHVVYSPELFPGAIIRHPMLIDILTGSDSEKPTDNSSRGAAYVYPGPRDCEADEMLDDPAGEKAAAEYVHSLMERMGADTSDTQRVNAIVDEVLSAQSKKNIVGLVFGVGVIIIGGAKNVRMMRRADAFVYEMVTECRDTPENRALEAALLRERGLPLTPDLLTHTTTPTSGKTARGRKRERDNKADKGRPAKRKHTEKVA